MGKMTVQITEVSHIIFLFGCFFVQFHLLLIMGKLFLFYLICATTIVDETCNKKSEKKRVINQIKSNLDTDLPPPKNAYSLANYVNGFLFISGQIGIENHPPAWQTTTAMAKINEILKAENLEFDNVVEVTIMLSESALRRGSWSTTTFMEHYNEVDRAYSKFFSEKRYPARTCYFVKELPGGVAVQIKAIAAAGNNIAIEWQHLLFPWIFGIAVAKNFS